MMQARFPELKQVEVSVSDETRERQFAVIRQSIAAVPKIRRVPLRRRVALWVAASFTVGLPTVAVAAENSVPGELLYPVKLAVEPVRALFDGDVAAVHRVEELERMAESDAPASDLDRAFDRASRAADEVDSPELEQRIESVREAVRDRRSVDEPVTDRAPDQSSPRDGEQPSGTDQPPTSNPDSTTTTAARDDGDGGHNDGSRGSDSGSDSSGDGSTSTSGPRGDSDEGVAGRGSGDGAGETP